MTASKKRDSAGVNKQKHIACLAGEKEEFRNTKTIIGDL